jgi:hypothetical protein
LGRRDDDLEVDGDEGALLDGVGGGDEVVCAEAVLWVVQGGDEVVEADEAELEGFGDGRGVEAREDELQDGGEVLLELGTVGC